MMTCALCYRSNPDEAAYCLGCFSKLKDLPPDREREYIGFVLAELPAWQSHGFVTESEARVLHGEFSRRARVAAQSGSTILRSVTVAPPVSNQPPQSHPGPQTPSPAPRIRYQPMLSSYGLPAALPTGPDFGTASSAPAPPNTPPVSHTLPPRATAPPPTPWLAEFLEAHWLKLLAALAALFIFVGMRQILQWEWVSALVIHLIPVLPIGLTVAFYFFGFRALKTRTIGGFAYCAVAIVLASFSVFSVNKHWLSGAIQPQSLTVLLGICTSTLLAGVTLWRTRDSGFLHLTLAGAAASLYSALLVVRPTSWFMPKPMWLFAAAFEGLALIYLTAAWRLDRSDSDEATAAEAGMILRMWAHICVTLAVAITLVPIAGGTGRLTESGVMLIAAAALAAMTAQWFSSSAATYAAGALSACAAFLFTCDMPYDRWYEYSGAAAVLAVFYLGMSALNESQKENAAERPPISKSYLDMAMGAAALAGALLLARLAGGLSGAASPVTAWDWPQGVAIASLCASLYAFFAIRLRKPSVLYAASAMATYAITLASNRLLPTSTIFGQHMFAHDLLPFIAGALILGTVLRSDTKNSNDERLDWGLPIVHSSLAALFAGSVSAIFVGARDWSGSAPRLVLIPYSLLAVIGAWLSRRDEVETLPRTWCAVAVTTTVSVTALWAEAYCPGRPWTPVLAAGLSTIGAAWVVHAFAQLTRRISDSGVFESPLTWMAGLTAVTGGIVCCGAANEAMVWMSIGFAGAFLLLLRLGLVDRTNILISGSFVSLLISAFRLGYAASQHGALSAEAGLVTVVFLLITGSAYGLAGAAERRTDLAWLAAAAAAMAGVSGWAFGDSGSAIRLATAIVSGLGLMAASIGTGISAARTKQSSFSYAAALFALGAYARLGSLYFHPLPVWTALAILPAVLGLAVTARLLRVEDDSLFHDPLRHIAAAASIVGLSISLIHAVDLGAYNPIALALLVYSIVFAAAALDSSSDGLTWGIASAALLAGGFGFAFAAGRGAELEDAVTAALPAAGVIASTAYARIAWRSELSIFGNLSALAAVGAWIATAIRVLEVPSHWWSFAALPALVIIYAAGHSLRDRKESALGIPLRQTAAAVSLLGLFAAVLAGIDDPRKTSLQVTITITAYSLVYLAAVILRRTPEWTAATVGTLTLAYGYRLGTIGLSEPKWAFGFACAAAFWLLVARAVERRENIANLSAPIYSIGSCVAALASAVGLVYVNEPHQGMFTILALAVAGAVYAGHFFMGKGDAYAHAGFAAYFLAYALYLYDGMKLNPGVIDLYMIPVGLYLLIIGHIAGKRGQADSAAALWWMGLLTVLTPTFVAFYTRYENRGTPIHAFLLLFECVGAIGWGIAQRIKAFVFAGTLFSLAYIATLAYGVAVEIWSGLFAVVMGVLILMFVFYVSLNQEALRRWMNRMGEEWRLWR